MTRSAERAVAIIGVGAILPGARDAATFWRNVREGQYAISEVDPARWDPSLYYDPDPRAPEKTYSKIGGWVRDWDWDPLAWKLPMPPKVTDAMDDAQKWAVACTRMALQDAGWPERQLNLDRTGVVLGSALGGEHHYLTALRISLPELARELEHAPSFAALAPDVRATIESELRSNVDAWLPPISEDTMPGELTNCTAGRIANLFNLHGPNYTVDAACASAMAAMDASIESLVEGTIDVAITGGVDRNMGASSFVKFCAIGALSPTGTRPYADGADGFVMGEGAALFVLKRLADAERDGDRIYAVVRGIGGPATGGARGSPRPTRPASGSRSSGRGARRPVTRRLHAGRGPRHVDARRRCRRGREPDGGVRRGAARAGVDRARLREVQHRPSQGRGGRGRDPQGRARDARQSAPAEPQLRRAPTRTSTGPRSPFAVNTELREWDAPPGRTRVGGVSAFGFGGTNFHVVLEEYVPGACCTANGRGASIAGARAPHRRRRRATRRYPRAPGHRCAVPSCWGPPTRRRSPTICARRSREARQGRHLEPAPPSAAALEAPERIGIDYGDGDDLVGKAEAALKALQAGNPAAWKALRGRGVYRGSGPAGQGRLPLHRPGQPVREHARPAAAVRAGRRRDVR